MTSAFCKKCMDMAEIDLDYCSEHMGEQSEETEAMDCGYPCSGVCRSCGQPVVYVTMLPRNEQVAMNPEFEHGGNIEIRPNKAGRLYAKETGPDPEQRKFIVHSIACIERKPRSKADALVPDTSVSSQPNHRKTWHEERSEMIQEAIKSLE